MITPLSERATIYLASKKRVTTIVEQEKLAQVFANNNAPLFPPLIDFQQQFGGYIFYSGTDAIKFDLIRGQSDHKDTDLSGLVKFTRSERNREIYKFICASSENLIEFELDEQGRYYEDGKPVSKSFSKLIERMAIYDEMKSRVGFQQIGSRTNRDEEHLIKSNGLEIIPEASDDMIQWYKNENMYMEVVLGVMTLFGNSVTGNLQDNISK